MLVLKTINIDGDIFYQCKLDRGFEIHNESDNINVFFKNKDDIEKLSYPEVGSNDKRNYSVYSDDEVINEYNIIKAKCRMLGLNYIELDDHCIAYDCGDETRITGLLELDSPKLYFKDDQDEIEWFRDKNVKSCKLKIVESIGLFENFWMLRLANSIDFSKDIEYRPKKLYKGFLKCKAYKIDLTGIDIEDCYSLESTFEGCRNLIWLNISNWDTSNVESMKRMFSVCRNIKRLNLLNFSTHKVKKIEGMFEYCQKLIALNTSNFDLDNTMLSSIRKMFNCCTEIKDIELGVVSLNESKSAFGIFDGTELNTIKLRIPNNNALVTLHKLLDQYGVAKITAKLDENGKLVVSTNGKLIRISNVGEQYKITFSHYKLDENGKLELINNG